MSNTDAVPEMISFKEYAKGLVKGLPDFFTVGYALKEKREAGAKEEIEKILYKDNLFGGKSNEDFLIAKYIGMHRIIQERPGIWLKKSTDFCKRYGKDDKEFVKDTIQKLEPKYRNKIDFLKKELERITSQKF